VPAPAVQPRSRLSTGSSLRCQNSSLSCQDDCLLVSWRSSSGWWAIRRSRIHLFAYLGPTEDFQLRDHGVRSKAVDSAKAFRVPFTAYAAATRASG